MAYIHSLIPLFVLCLANAVVTRLPFQQAMFETTDNFCNTARICRGNDTENDSKGRASCCTDCSCEADCDQSRCCFPESRRENETMRERTQCLYASTVQPDEAFHHLFASYNMIVDTPEQGCSIDTDTTESPRTGGSWLGAMALQEFHPVFSKSSGKIFKNMQLVNCYGEKNILPWKSELICERDRELSSYALYITDPKRYPYCKFNFYYPGDKADIEHERCFINLIDKCANVTYDIPTGTSLTREEIRAACESGFNSPYVRIGHYANVFCHICNGANSYAQSYCDGPGLPKDEMNSHVMLLRTDVTARRATSTTDISRRTLACPTVESLEHECRTLFCPTGKIRTIDNRCVWPFIDVGHRTINLFLDLTPSQSLTVDDIKDTLRNGGNEAFRAKLINPWPKQWKLKRLEYLPVKAGNDSNVTLYATFQIYTKAQHATILKTVSKNIKKKWRLRIGEVDLELEQRMSAQSEPSVLEDKVYMYIFTDSNRSHFDIQQTNIISTSDFSRPLGIRITKLFFCNQVALSADEFTAEHDNRIIVLNQSRRIFLNGEFGLIEDNIQQQSARVCLSDSSYVARSFTSSFEMRTLSSFQAFCVIVLYIIIVN